MFLQTAVWQYVKTWVSVHVRTHACMAGDMSSRVLVNTSALCQRICRSNFKCESAHTSWRRMSGTMMQDIHMNIYIYVYIYIHVCVSLWASGSMPGDVSPSHVSRHVSQGNQPFARRHVSTPRHMDMCHLSSHVSVQCSDNS